MNLTRRREARQAIEQTHVSGLQGGVTIWRGVSPIEQLAIPLAVFASSHETKPEIDRIHRILRGQSS